MSLHFNIPTAEYYKQETQPKVDLEGASPLRDFLIGGPRREIIYVHAPARIGDEYAISRSDEKAITEMIEKLKEHVRNRLGESVLGFNTEYTDNATDCIDFVALVVRISAISTASRMALREELNQIISSSESLAVRERVIVNFR